MSLMLLWFKLNIYTFLLFALLICSAVAMWMLPVFHHCYFYLPLACVWLWLAQNTWKIAFNYGYKKRVYYKMVSIAREHYDRRVFLKYMGSPCMRHVVFWSLRALNRPFKEYRIIKHLAKRPHYYNSPLAGTSPTDLNIRRVRVTYNNGRAEFQMVDTNEKLTFTTNPTRGME